MPAHTHLAERGEPGLKKRLWRFFLAVGCLVLLVYLAQMPIRYIPAFNHYSNEADKYGLNPGALYYSDVPITLEAEQHNRAAVKKVDDAHRRERASVSAKSTLNN